VPLPSHSPPPSAWEIKSFQAGEYFVRIYDHEKATDKATGARLYRPIDFNSTLLDDSPDTRGRYSARKTRNKSEYYSYLYVGEQQVDERAALLECIDVLSLGRSADNATRMVDLASLASLSFVYARLRRPVTLLDISSEPNASVFLADFAVLQGKNYRLTRRWARYFRATAPYLDGLYYSPVRYGSCQFGGNIVLFGPHGDNPDILSSEYTEFTLDSPAGRGRLLALSRAVKISLS